MKVHGVPHWRNRATLTLGCLLTIASNAGGQRPGFSLEQVLGAPFPENLVAAPSGRAVAWVHLTKGVRNVWVAEAPGWRGRQLTSYTQDDGQEIGELALTPDGRTLFYVRGGPPNRRGEIPNPTSDPAGAEQAVWRVPVAGGPPTRIGQGTSPLASPRGDLLLFRRRGQLMALSLTASEEAKPLIQVSGGPSDLSFSPDGGKLAFSSTRGDHAFIAVYDILAKQIR